MTWPTKTSATTPSSNAPPHCPYPTSSDNPQTADPIKEQTVDTAEIVASLIEDSSNPGALDRMQERMATLTPDQQAEVWGRLTDNTPNPTGDR